MRSKFGLVLVFVMIFATLSAVPVGASEEAEAADQSQQQSRSAPCVRGTAFVPELEGHPILETGAFPCKNVDLLSFLTVDELGGAFDVGTGRGNDVWGWTDSETGREYVIAGLEVGTSFVDISDPMNPVFLAHLPTSATNNIIQHDIKVYADHAYIVSESANHRMQVFDLTTLGDLDPAGAPHTVAATAMYEGFGRSHNIVINEDIGFAYAVGQREDVEGCASGMHIVDIREPASPTFAGCYEDSYVHDAHCLTYDGPDTRFTGAALCVVSTGNTQSQSIAIVDVSDPADPVRLSEFVSYPNSAFSHQGWVLDGHRYYLHGSESTSRTPQVVEVFDLADLTDPQHIGAFETPAQSTHHNLYQRGRFAFQSNYSSGLRVYDTRNVAGGELEEVAFFDVYPPHDNPGFGIGSWSNYVDFPSGVIAVHGYQGLWLVQPQLGFPRQVRVELLGENEPNGGDPDGSGSARVSWDQTGRVCFDIRVRDIAPATGAHIHSGRAGVNGPIVVDFDIANNGLQGCVQSDPEVVDAIRRNLHLYYVNVHNAEYPGGAIRGQLG